MLLAGAFQGLRAAHGNVSARRALPAVSVPEDSIRSTAAGKHLEQDMERTVALALSLSFWVHMLCTHAHSKCMLRLHSCCSRHAMVLDAKLGRLAEVLWAMGEAMHTARLNQHVWRPRMNWVCMVAAWTLAAATHIAAEVAGVPSGIWGAPTGWTKPNPGGMMGSTGLLEWGWANQQPAHRLSGLWWADLTKGQGGAVEAAVGQCLEAVVMWTLPKKLRKAGEAACGRVCEFARVALLSLWPCTALVLGGLWWCARRATPARRMTLAAFPCTTIATNLIVGMIKRAPDTGREPGELVPEQHLHEHRPRRPCYTPGKGPRHMRVQNRAFHQHTYGYLKNPCFTPGKGPSCMRVQNQAFHLHPEPEPTPPEAESELCVHPQSDCLTCRGGHDTQQGPDSQRYRQTPSNHSRSMSYWEKQEGRHCVVHAWNHMHGRRVLDPQAVLSFVNAAWTAAERAGCLDLTNPLHGQRMLYCSTSGNYSVETFNTYLICQAILSGASTAPQLVGAQKTFWGGEPTPRHPEQPKDMPLLTRSNVLGRLGAVDTLQLHYDTQAGYGHAVCMRKMAGEWYLFDSEVESGPKRVGDNWTYKGVTGQVTAWRIEHKPFEAAVHGLFVANLRSMVQHRTGWGLVAVNIQHTQMEVSDEDGSPTPAAAPAACAGPTTEPTNNTRPAAMAAPPPLEAAHAHPPEGNGHMQVSDDEGPDPGAALATAPPTLSPTVAAADTDAPAPPLAPANATAPTAGRRRTRTEVPPHEGDALALAPAPATAHEATEQAANAAQGPQQRKLIVGPTRRVKARMTRKRDRHDHPAGMDIKRFFRPRPRHEEEQPGPEGAAAATQLEPGRARNTQTAPAGGSGTQPRPGGTRHAASTTDTRPGGPGAETHPGNGPQPPDCLDQQRTWTVTARAGPPHGANRPAA